MGQQRRGKPSGGRDVTVSKALSLLLRHAAEKEGLKLDAQGYANVADVVRPHIYPPHWFTTPGKPDLALFILI